MYVTRGHILTKAKGLLQRLANGNLGQQSAVKVLNIVQIISSPTLLHFVFFHFPFFFIFLVLSSIQSCHPFSSFQHFTQAQLSFFSFSLFSLSLSLSLCLFLTFYPFFLPFSFLFLSVDEGFGMKQQRSNDGKECDEAESNNEIKILEKVVALSRCVQP